MPQLDDFAHDKKVRKWWGSSDKRQTRTSPCNLIDCGALLAPLKRIPGRRKSACERIKQMAETVTMA